MWEFDDDFVDYLRKQRILGIEMELATLFSVAYHYEVPTGSIMLVSDMPLNRSGKKDKKRHDEIYSTHMEPHLELGIDAAMNLQQNWGDVEKRLRSEW